MNFIGFLVKKKPKQSQRRLRRLYFLYMSYDHLRKKKRIPCNLRFKKYRITRQEKNRRKSWNYNSTFETSKSFIFFWILKYGFSIKWFLNCCRHFFYYQRCLTWKTKMPKCQKPEVEIAQKTFIRNGIKMSSISPCVGQS